MTALTSAEIRAMRALSQRDGAAVFWPVASEVAAEFGYTMDDIRGPTKGNATLARARAWVCYCANERGASANAIARFIGKDHTSVLEAIKRAKAEIDHKPWVFKSVRAA